MFDFNHIRGGGLLCRPELLEREGVPVNVGPAGGACPDVVEPGVGFAASCEYQQVFGPSEGHVVPPGPVELPTLSAGSPAQPSMYSASAPPTRSVSRSRPFSDPTITTSHSLPLA